jgi:hypothetical protein
MAIWLVRVGQPMEPIGLSRTVDANDTRERAVSVILARRKR